MGHNEDDDIKVELEIGACGSIGCGIVGTIDRQVSFI